MVVASARVRVRMRWYRHGSVLGGTIESGCAGVETDVEITSPAPPERVAALVRCARRGCYVESLIARPVPITGRTLLNGKELDGDAEPDAGGEGAG